MNVWREPLIASLLLAAGCGGATPPPPELPAPDTPPPAATATAAATPPAAPSTSASASAQAPAPARIPFPPPLTEALAPLNRTFVTVTLPGVKRGLQGISGRSSSELWFLTTEEQVEFARTVGGEVLRYDGKRIKSFGHPCDASMFGNVVVSKGAVVAIGYRPWSRGVHPMFRAALRGNGTWDCDEDDGGFSAGHTISSGDHVWELSCSSGDCRLEASGGPSVALPTFHPSLERNDDYYESSVEHLWMHGVDDGWMARRTNEGGLSLLRYNGVTWSAVAELDPWLTVADMWADDAKQLWLTVRRAEGDDGPADALLRFDGRAFNAVPVPEDFAVRWIAATGARDIWFQGQGRTLYQWDGKQLRKGEAPFRVIGMWAAPGGELWIIGGDAADGGPPPGVVAHTAPLSAAGNEPVRSKGKP